MYHSYAQSFLILREKAKVLSVISKTLYDPALGYYFELLPFSLLHTIEKPGTFLDLLEIQWLLCYKSNQLGLL